MKARINASANTSAKGMTNPCPRCGNIPRYKRSDCGGYHLGCGCGFRTESYTETITPKVAELLRLEWNESTLTEAWTKGALATIGAEEGSIILVRSQDSAIILTRLSDEMDGVLDFLKREARNAFSVDYDILQATPNGHLVHISTSRILAYVGKWDGFDTSVLEAK